MRSRSSASQQQVGKLVVLRFEGTEVPAYVRRRPAQGLGLRRDPVPRQHRRSEAAAGADRPSCDKAGKAAGATPIVCTDQEGGVIRNVVWAPPAAAAVRAAARRGRQGGGAGAASAPASTSRSRRSPTCRRARGAALASARSRAIPSAPRRRPRPRSPAGWPAASPPPPSTSPASAARPSTPTTARRPIGGGAPTAADLAPFKAAIAAERAADHELARRLPAARLAATSPRSRRPILQDLLRDQLHFGGVVMTDSIEAAAVRATGSHRAGRGALDPRRQRHRADDRPGLVDPRPTARCSPRPARRARSGRWSRPPRRAFSRCSTRSDRTFVRA